MKTSKKFVWIFVIIIALILIFLVFNPRENKKGFEVNTFSIKTVIKQGEVATYPLKITNLDERKTFVVSAEGKVKDLVSLNEKEFDLEKDEEKSLSLSFNNGGFLPGVYVGSLYIEANNDLEKLPLVLEVQSKDGLVATNLNVASAYKEILPGGETVVSIKIFNLNDTKVHTVKSLYEIKNLEGEIIISEKENIVMESELVLSKTIALPEKVALGNYVFDFTVDFEGSIATSSYLFEVVEEKSFQDLEIINTNIFVIIILVFLVGILVLILYMMYERKTLLLQLKRQHSVEMSGSLRKISERKRELVARASPIQKKKIKKKFKEIKRKVVGRIKEKHKKQKAEFKKLRKTHKKSKMESKLAQWKKEGFNVGEFLVGSKKIKRAKSSDVKSLEKKGYDVSAIKK